MIVKKSSKRLQPLRSDSIPEEDEGDMEDVDIEEGHGQNTIHEHDSRFHPFFAFVMHAGQTIATYYSFLMVINPNNTEIEQKLQILSPFGFLIWPLVLLGTDKIDPEFDEETGRGKHWEGIFRFLLKSPNILCSSAQIVFQRTFVLMAMVERGEPKYIFSSVAILVGMFACAKIIYRQRVKLADTIKPEESMPNRQTAHRRLSFIGRSTHAAHAMNYNTLRISEKDFKNLVLKELPRVGFGALMTVIYFCSEAFGCMQRVKEEFELSRNSSTSANVTYCYDIPVDQCTKDVECYAGNVECNDIVISSTRFATLFVIYAIMRLYVSPLMSLRYSIKHLMSFDMVFKDQLLFLVFSICSVMCLQYFASSDEIDDWCEYVNPKNTEGDIIKKRSQQTRELINIVLQFLMLLTFGVLMLPSEFKSGRGKRLTKWLHDKMRTEETAAVAPVVRSILLLITGGLTLLPGPAFIYFAFKAKDEGGDIDSRWALKAGNAYAMMVSSWGVVFASMALFIFSRPRKKDSEMKKKLAYCLLPLNHILTAVGCWYLSVWEEHSDVENPIFGRAAYNNIFIAAVSTFFYYPAQACQELLISEDVHDEDTVPSHILNIFTLASTILLPAAYLYAESAGCLNAHGYWTCYSLIAANYTVELQLILFYVFFLLFGFTLGHVNFSDFFEFKASGSILWMMGGVLISTLLSFAVFGMRPRDADELSEPERPEYLRKDPTWTFSTVSQYTIALIWFVNYSLQIIYVWRKLKRSNERKSAIANAAQEGNIDNNDNNDDNDDNDDNDKGKTSCFEQTYQLEKRLASKFSNLFNVSGDDNVKMSRAFSLAIAPIPHLFLALSIYFYISPVESPKTGLLYVIWLASGDLALISCLMLAFSNLSKESFWAKYGDFYWLILFCGAEYLVAAHPNHDQHEKKLMVVFSTIYLAGAMTLIYAKSLMMKYIRVSILKRHLINSTILALSQLPSIIFLSAEYFGCMLRAYYDESEREITFNLTNVHGSAFCASERSGTKAISFQIAMMIATQFAIGPFSYYDTKSDLSIERISRLKISLRQGVQILLVFLSFMLALYLFGTRGKSTEHYTADQIDGDIVDFKYKLLYSIYMIWVFLWFWETARQIREFLIDGSFLQDLRESQLHESENTHRASLGKARTSIWNLKSVSNADSFSENSEVEMAQQERRTEDRKKRFSSYGKTEKFINAETKGDVEVDHTVFDFSPGML
ncbi:hypothetical protein TrST_g13080 [Triparma strigata]|uniref:Uncharacterized protein n=1 Tax=Triparma strigata TaxID=1606541 RepID=A0A9W7APN7_9STRA|nr:hypothetical protein TrST_g13080 [Triparma strigata]